MNYTKKIAALLLAAAMMIPAAGCAKGGSSSGTEDSKQSGSADSKSGGDTKIPLSTDENNQIKVDLTYEDEPKNNEFPVTQPATTAKRGEDGSLYVQQTDINGGTVTQAGGEAATVLYTGTTVASSYAEPEYTPNYKSFFSMWLDTSKQADYVFDGEFLVFDVKINDDAKDGVYPVEIYHTDFSNWGKKGETPKTLNVTTNVGYICVNAAEPTPDHQTGGDLTLTPGVVSGKPGDTVKLAVKAENNAGFVGFRVWLSYDSNAVKFLKTTAGADFDTSTRPSGKDVE